MFGPAIEPGGAAAGVGDGAAADGRPGPRMTWVRGYVRLDDRVSMPHPVLRRRPAFVIQDVARTTRSLVDEELREHGLSWLGFTLLLVEEAIPAVQRAEQAALKGLDAKERRRLHALLDRLVRDDLPAWLKRF